jgi:hypothetical protein
MYFDAMIYGKEGQYVPIPITVTRNAENLSRRLTLHRNVKFAMGYVLFSVILGFISMRLYGVSVRSKLPSPKWGKGRGWGQKERGGTTYCITSFQQQ